MELNFSSSDPAALSNFTVQNFVENIIPLAFFAIGIFLYGLFIFKFYKFIAKRDILILKMGQHSSDFKGFLKKLIQISAYILENLIVIPLLIFFWFLVMAAILLIMGKTYNSSVILLISMGLVGAIRIAAYYQEELAQELSKLVPLSLLAVFLSDLTYFSIENSIQNAMKLPELWGVFIYYFVVVICLEFTLRILKAIHYQIKNKDQKTK